MLKLVALDADDLGVISAHMQDAVLRRGDIGYDARKRQFALVANRYAWVEGEGQRRRTGLHFDRVLGVRSQGVPRSDGDAVLSLLAVTFEPGEAPAGVVVLTFSGGGLIRLSVECIEASLKDMGPAWAAARRPSHDSGDEA